MSENLDLDNDSGMIRYRGLDRASVSVPVFCFGHVECREVRRSDTEDYRIGKVTSRTDSLASVMSNANECAGLSRTLPSSLRKRSGLNFLGQGASPGHAGLP
jgi:hypothetical protein